MNPEDWQEKKISECIELVYGRGLPEKERKKGSVPVFGSNGIIGYHHESIVKAPGIIIGRKGSVGEVIFSKNDFWPIDTTYYVKVKKDNDIIFWYYFLKTLKLNQMNSHSAVPGLNRDNVYEILCLIPKLSEQKLIANILLKLDDKIELNQQMNKTLEQIGQEIFKHWFVDFEFPNEEGEPYRSSGGEMVDSELGEIPKGWAIVKLDNYVNVIRGCSYRSDELKPSNTALVTLKSIERGGGFKEDGLKSFIGEYKIEQIIQPGEIVVAHTDLTQKAEVLGKPATVRRVKSFNILIASLDLAIVRPSNDSMNKEFLYFLLKKEDFQNHAYGYAKGTTVLHLDKKAIPEYQFNLPTKRLMNQFGEIVNTILNKMQIAELESNNLSSIRDALLPKLMSGEIRVKVPQDVNS